MTHVFIQIYEVQTPAEAEQMILLGADHIGSVILSEREWKADSIRATVNRVQAEGACSSLIPLFSNIDTIQHLLDYYRPDIIHFCEDIAGQSQHGAFIEHLLKNQERVKNAFPEIRIMRSIPIVPAGAAHAVATLELARRFQPLSDFLLTDTYLPEETKPAPDGQPVKGFIGITGKVCDWDMAAKLVAVSAVPVILAGGLSATNVYAGIRRALPAGVDSCTETNARKSDGSPIRFKKDPQRVKQFIDAVRRAERPQ